MHLLSLRNLLRGARWASGAFLLLIAGGAVSLLAQVKPPEVFVARNTSEYWNPPTGQRDQPQRIDLEMVVSFYDPEWHLLWGEATDVPSWFDNAGQPLPMKSGQRVRITGTYIPSVGIDGKTVHVAVLADGVPQHPIPVANVDDVARYDARWVSAQGYVARQVDYDLTHVEYDVVVQNRVVTAFLRIGSTDPIPQLTDRFVQLQFLFASRRDPAGHLVRIDGWMNQVSDITIIGSADQDPRFSAAVRPISQIGAATAGEWVHLQGKLEAMEPGRSITIRDASGQVTINTAQPLNAQLGANINVIGRAQGRGYDATLTDAICRVMSGPEHSDGFRGAADESRLKLRLADQVLGLGNDDADRHYAVSVRGVVTWSAPGASFFYLQDGSGGICVRRGSDADPVPAIGSMVAVDGVSRMGPFAPELELRQLHGLGKLELPVPRVTTLDEALTGVREAERIEMRGLLRAVDVDGPWTRLSLTTATGEFTALAPRDASFQPLVGAIVRITGVCAALTNSQRQLTGVQLWVADPLALQVDRPRETDPFSILERTIASLRQFRAFRALDQQVRVSGIVTYDRPGRFLYLQQHDVALLVLHRDTTPIKPGERIDVVGLPGRDGPRVVLRDAIWRARGRQAEPAPLAISATKINEEADGRLVQVRAQLQTKVVTNDGVRLLLSTKKARFDARLPGPDVAALPEIGSTVELTGIYVIEYDEYQHPRGFALELRSPADIRVLQAAPWWTPPRALGIAGAFAVCALIGVAWVVVLRRRVQKQTAQIRTQLEKEKRFDAELERAARLESLGVLAGGIAHDFNNLLTVIIANLGLAAMDDRVQEAAGSIIADAERGARRAAELTQQLLTFAKGGDPVRRAVALPDVVRESAEFARHGSRVRCAYDFEPNLPPASVDRGQISRVVHNLVLNAAQAMPEGGVVRIHLGTAIVKPDEMPNLGAGRYLKLAVTDEGRGIAAEHLARIFEPYFSTKPKNNGLGLATVHSIVKKHQGHITVRSQQGHGTTFDIWLPVANDIPTPAAPAAAAPCATAGVRVLFMDDDEIIRRTAAALLEQLGYQPKVVADGMDVVREYEAALHAGRKYDVVILDLTVPGGLGGRAAMEILRRIDPSVRGIVSSGYSNDPVLSNFQAYGFCAVVPKPYVVDDLARAIQDVIAMKAVPLPQASAPLAV